MADDYNDSVEFLYEEILKRLNSDKPISEVDTDSLIEVYDYAYDLADEFVCSEVMSEVLNREPDCVDMLERKAMRYMQQSEFRGARAIASSLPANSFIRRLVSVYLDWNEQSPKMNYDRLFKGLKHGAVSDFGGICIIDMALGTETLEQLVGYLSEVQNLLRYPQDFTADLAETLLDNQKFGLAAIVFQELTNLEPFTIDHWIKLADIYIHQLTMFEDAANCLDYALAIDPESGSARLLLAELMLKCDKDVDKVIEIAQSLISENTLVKEALYLKAGAYINQEKPAEALDALMQYIDDCVNTLDICLLMITVADGRLSQAVADKLVRIIGESDVSDVVECVERSKSILSNECYLVFLGCISAALYPCPESLRSYVLLYHYLSGDYCTVIDTYDSISKVEDESDDDLLYAFARAWAGQTDGLQSFLNDLAERLSMDKLNGVSNDRLVLIQSLNSISMLMDYLSNCELERVSVDVEALTAIDPFQK